jgi:hypothetical protein
LTSSARVLAFSATFPNAIPSRGTELDDTGAISPAYILIRCSHAVINDIKSASMTV